MRDSSLFLISSCSSVIFPVAEPVENKQADSDCERYQTAEKGRCDSCKKCEKEREHETNAGEKKTQKKGCRPVVEI